MMNNQPSLTHFDEAGSAHMVDVTAKAETMRQATAAGTITMSAPAYTAVRAGRMAKGDVLGVARIAGIMAAKRVPELIPLAHSLPLNLAAIDFALDDTAHAVHITAKIGCTGKTGVEMEALTAVSITALTIYDMCKALDKGMVISNIRLLAKSGGKSGSFVREKTG